MIIRGSPQQRHARLFAAVDARDIVRSWVMYLAAPVGTLQSFKPLSSSDSVKSSAAIGDAVVADSFRDEEIRASHLSSSRPHQSKVIVSLKVVSARTFPGAPGSTNTRLM